MKRLSILFLIVILFSGCATIYNPPVDYMILDGGFWSAINDTTNIQYPSLSNLSGNVTVHNHLFVGEGFTLGNNGSIELNASCVSIVSPDGLERVEVCDNASIHIFSNGAQVVNINETEAFFDEPLTIADTIEADFYKGDGGGLFNLNVNVSDLNLTTPWQYDGNDIYYDGGNVIINNSITVINGTTLLNNVNVTANVYAQGNITVNGSISANALLYPDFDGDEGTVMTTDGNGTLVLRAFELSQLADYYYGEEEAINSTNETGVEITTLALPLNLTGGFYRGQAYIEGKTSQVNKRFTVKFYIDDIEGGATTIRTRIADEWDFASVFRGKLNIPSGNHTAYLKITNLDNVELSWQRVRLELMKVGNS